tara:strand:- start:9524 stop:9724 length:201 start_codon:yes stop_codon:yes gene_type:complete
MPALAKLVELPTYTGLFVFLARTLERRVVKSRVLPCVKSDVLNVSEGAALYTRPVSGAAPLSVVRG